MRLRCPMGIEPALGRLAPGGWRPGAGPPPPRAPGAARVVRAGAGPHRGGARRRSRPSLRVRLQAARGPGGRAVEARGEFGAPGPFAGRAGRPARPGVPARRFALGCRRGLRDRRGRPGVARALEPEPPRPLSPGRRRDARPAPAAWGSDAPGDAPPPGRSLAGAFRPSGRGRDAPPRAGVSLPSAPTAASCLCRRGCPASGDSRGLHGPRRPELRSPTGGRVGRVGATRPRLPGSRARPMSWPTRPGRVVVDVRLNRPGSLVVLEGYAPGWRARVDGAPAPVAPGNAIFLTVPLNAGEHRVELGYRPPERSHRARRSPRATLVAAALAMRVRRPRAYSSS